MGIIRLIAIAIAAGTALTNSTTETRLNTAAQATIPKYTLRAGKRIGLRACVRATATNSTDTLQVRVRIGGTTLTGTVVADTGAVDVANNDMCVFDLEIVCRTDGTTGTLLVSGLSTILGAEGTVTSRAAFEALSNVNTEADLLVEITGVWSVANAGDSCQLEQYILQEAA